METTQYFNVAVTQSKESRLSSIDFSSLGFGNYFSDHMLMAEYANGHWGTPAIVPFGNLSLSPSILALHYGQSVFEGMKAFIMKDGKINIFRAQRHYERLNKSLERMGMPPINTHCFIDGLKALIKTDRAWIPTDDGSSLYLRPLVFAADKNLGVKISETYKFITMTCPVGSYFKKPLKLKVEDQYVRAAEGGAGYAKCAGNYGSAFYPTHLAQQQGFDQLLWTDAKEHKYIDESGPMNVMFVANGKLITPALSSSILDGVTRDCVLTLAESLNMTKEERKISVEEIQQGLTDGSITEAFGVGTAAVVSEIRAINIRGNNFTLPAAHESSFQNKVKEKINNIRLGKEEDVYGWNCIVD